jgi:hypothetical protein
MADDRDPAAHWAMGRAFWLRGRQDQSIELHLDGARRNAFFDVRSHIRWAKDVSP